ncbi:hypothetical protein [Saccharibacillus kuerlensis]|uniref:Uncharacterized protein n=1 Tax=Saccharibacillus kuerlensis TaxID=459527 RepID=A0ABQ2L571_9BACL|nr:hypothetical protein [Saccharibacillus kuerlensis]GGO03852.1 hypothetical protein GCM10010969_28460 [Saccharibacillus kuerlensis]
MNSRMRKTLLSLTTVSLAVPFLLAPLPSPVSDAVLHAASAETPAPMDDPARAQLLREIEMFKHAATHMSQYSMQGSLISLYSETYADRIAAETTKIAKSESSTPAQLARALKYVRFNLDDYIEKGKPYTWYMLHKMLSYLQLHFPTGDGPGEYSQATVDAFIAKAVRYLERVDAGEDSVVVFREYIAAMTDFYASTNP